jgi:electron transfer flavoprotein-quinone oxidoreductase
VSDFDAIVVGGGLAGLATAYLLAKGGAETLVVERGTSCGSKNMTGGRLYSHSLERLLPGFAATAPVERRITAERISLLTADAATTLDYRSPRLGQDGQDSYSVLRSTFDPWLAEQAEAAGASIVTGIRVDGAIVRDGRVSGIRAGGEDMSADVTVLADGVNSLLATQLGMRRELAPDEVAVGVKTVIAQDEKTIDTRFGCPPGEGVAWLFAGQPSGGRLGGGFLYTNRESLSVGIVVTLSELVKGTTSLPQLMDDFLQHPAVRPLVEGGRPVEYSAHLVPERGLDMMPELYRDGVLVVGDAAGMCINLGYTVRGMDLAIGSAECAAQTILDAKEAGDFSAAALARYRSRLDASFVLQDMSHYRRFPGFLDTTPRIFSGYPELAAGLMQELFTVNGQPPERLLKKAMRAVRSAGPLNLVRDGLRGVRAL